MAKDKWSRKELSELSNDELIQIAGNAGVAVEDFDDEKALVREMTGKPKPEEKRPDNVTGTDSVPAAALKGNASKTKEIQEKEGVAHAAKPAGKRNVKGGKPGDIVTLQYVGRSSAFVGEIKWLTGVRVEMTRHEANVIRGKLPRRFSIEG